uniref:Uncharacterized protein n=1 Tax=Cacopsylla melanoneura TaxID=428564 RepID=A0A8D8W7F1_9HEMI
MLKLVSSLPSCDGNSLKYITPSDTFLSDKLKLAISLPSCDNSLKPITEDLLSDMLKLVISLTSCDGNLLKCITAGQSSVTLLSAMMVQKLLGLLRNWVFVSLQ